eukprot:scaffold3765_cov122-Isochrysis_galbana.AAC.6
MQHERPPRMAAQLAAPMLARKREERAGGFGLRASASPPPTLSATPAGASDRRVRSGSSDGAALAAERRHPCDPRAAAVECAWRGGGG